jgi:hypothetical protein
MAPLIQVRMQNIACAVLFGQEAFVRLMDGDAEDVRRRLRGMCTHMVTARQARPWGCRLTGIEAAGRLHRGTVTPPGSLTTRQVSQSGVGRRRVCPRLTDLLTHSMHGRAGWVCYASGCRMLDDEKGLSRPFRTPQVDHLDALRQRVRSPPLLIGSMAGRRPPALVAICSGQYVGQLTAELVDRADEPGLQLSRPGPVQRVS